MLTIITVNFNSADFLANSLYCLKKLTKNKYKVYILDTGSNTKDFQKLKEITKNYNNISLERKNTGLKGSIAHGNALNYLVSKVNTPYFSILDADAIWLIKGWDKILISKINDKVKVIGTEAAGDKPRDFPLMYAIFFETETFRKLNIDFIPKDIAKLQDTGWELRKKYLKAGFQGKILGMKNTRIYKEGPFKNIICAEYYLDGYSHIFASHFGRGSTLGAAKYIRTPKGFFYKISIIGKYFLQRRGEIEKQEWIRICKEIINSQI
jgi:cellulose synthase/poly-beta-1,6-N-acetylglucosamine synthase-like glycosyltransferase